MAIGEVNPSSFDAYEGIRIVIPGAIAVSAYTGVAETFSPSGPSPTTNIIGAVVASLLIGLVLLFIDMPRKSAAFRNPLTPHQELFEWKIDPAPYGDALSLYLAMFDVSFPATIRNRALYMGSIFRIGFEGIYIVGITAIAALAATAAFPYVGPTRSGTTATRVVLFVVAAAHIVVFLGACFVRFNYLRTKGGVRLQRKEARKDVSGELAHELGLSGTVSLLTAAYAFPAFVDTHNGYVLLIATLPLTSVWAILYYRGRSPSGKPGRRRIRLAPPSAVLLFGLPTSLAALGAGLRLRTDSPLNTQAALAWGAATLAPSLLMLTRGHERKLNGSFTAQTNWMRANRNALMKQYDLQPATPPTPPVPAATP
jgi:hypothetical protein